ncbi:MAG: hypothetical protein IPH35_18735 [Rhodoferax sp.]|nr:hypothetical protein [Rhodoferax sp.]
MPVSTWPDLYNYAAPPIDEELAQLRAQAPVKSPILDLRDAGGGSGAATPNPAWPAFCQEPVRLSYAGAATRPGNRSARQGKHFAQADRR